MRLYARPHWQRLRIDLESAKLSIGAACRFRPPSEFDPSFSASAALPHGFFLSQVVLVITSCLLFYVGLTDLKEYRIRNELVLVLAGLFFLYAALSGRWVTIHWNIGFALLMFLIMLFAYTKNLMGGGDLKILTVAFLWVGVDCALLFSVLLFVFAALHTLAAKRGWLGAQTVDGRVRIAFAPAVAGALIGTFLLGCLEPLH
jgi:prepilin peptidase CpaA